MHAPIFATDTSFLLKVSTLLCRWGFSYQSPNEYINTTHLTNFILAYSKYNKNMSGQAHKNFMTKQNIKNYKYALALFLTHYEHSSTGLQAKFAN